MLEIVSILHVLKLRHKNLSKLPKVTSPVAVRPGLESLCIFLSFYFYFFIFRFSLFLMWTSFKVC